MKTIRLEEKYILEYIRDMLISLKNTSIQPKDIVYHHNCSYQNTPSILKHGILTIDMINKLGIQEFTDKELRIMSDYNSHVNGIDAISLSKVGLTDLYRDEDEYIPFSPYYVDLNISGDIKARRHTVHYGNEYLCSETIATDKLKSIDVRLLKYLENKQNSINNVIEKYNYLIDIAITLQQLNLNIPLREMSKENLTIDVNKAANQPKILIK